MDDSPKSKGNDDGNPQRRSNTKGSDDYDIVDCSYDDCDDPDLTEIECIDLNSREQGSGKKGKGKGNKKMKKMKKKKDKKKKGARFQSAGCFHLLCDFNIANVANFL